MIGDRSGGFDDPMPLVDLEFVWLLRFDDWVVDLSCAWCGK
jgi:hypothetical protein